MTTIRISEFHGLRPKLDRRRLPAGWSEIAENVRFDTGDLQPILEPASAFTITGDIGNFYHYVDESVGGSKFIAFGRNHEVLFARSPEPEDTHKRFYWNLKNPALSDDQVGLFMVSDPIAEVMTLGAGADFQQFANKRRVGIPAPAVAPVASDITSLQSVAFGGVASIARTSPIQINTSANQPFKDGQRVKILVNRNLRSAMIGNDGVPPDPGAEPGTETIGQVWALNGMTGIVSESNASSFKITGISAASFEPFDSEDIAAVSVERDITDQEMQDRFYVFTYVSEYGEEGPPSPPSNILRVFDEGTVSLDVTDSQHVFANSGGSRAGVNRIRVYRGTAGTNSTPEMFVGELPFAATGDDGDLAWVSGPGGSVELSWSGEIVDDVRHIDDGRPLQTHRWFPPPKRLNGIHMMPNGFMVGWKGNTLYFSEPYLPHAWNDDYKRTTEDDIVGVQSYGNTLVIGTRGRPYIARGSDPASMTISKVDFHAPLLKPRAMVDAGSGVFFPSSHGLIWIGAGGSRNLTKDHYDRRTWAVALDHMDQGVWMNGRALFFSRGLDPLMVDTNGDQLEISYVKGFFIGAAAASGTDLYIVVPLGAEYRTVQRFKADADTMTAVWQSGLLTAEKACNLAAGQLFADAYPVTLHVRHANLVTGQPNFGNMVQHTYTVTGPEPFRLHAGYLSREFQIRIETNRRVQQVILSTSMESLRRLP